MAGSPGLSQSVQSSSSEDPQVWVFTGTCSLKHCPRDTPYLLSRPWASAAHTAGCFHKPTLLEVRFVYEFACVQKTPESGSIDTACVGLCRVLTMRLASAFKGLLRGTHTLLGTSRMSKKPTVPAYIPHFWTKEIIALGAWGKPGEGLPRPRGFRLCL